MRLATVPVVLQSFIRGSNSGSNSMSQSFHQGIFSFSDGFDRPASTEQEQHHVAQQSRRDKLRVQGFGPSASGHALVGIEADGEVDEGAGVYEPATGATNMLSEMFNFPTAATPGPMPSELLANQIQGAYRLPSRPAGPMVGFGGDWYGNRQGGIMLGGSSSNNLSSIGEAKQINAESAAAMQLFLMNPQQQQRSPSPPPPTLHRHHQQAFQAGDGPFGTHHEASFGGGLVDTQGLSLSLSSSLQQFEIAKTDQELRVRDGLLYFNHSGGNNQNPQQQLQDHRGQQSQGQGQGQHIHMGYGPVGVNLLRNSKYARAAQELLEEFCSVGRGQFKGNRIGKHHASSSSNPNPNAAGASPSVAGSSSSSKEPPPLSPADRFEHQRKKSKLLSMLDEVDRRYNHYCDQMQMVVTSFDSVMGYGAATPYTALAQKAMSRHFRCLKDAIAAQLKRTCEALGEKEGGSGSGITKGETPRLRLLDQSLRQQRAFHQMGMMEQEAWRPQRGLPERSVNILRAWLFEHFLHPYPTDADKHLLARQTGLSRNQVSNWFINARVRLWKPMVEEMYQHESKDETDDSQREDGSQYQRSGSPTQQQQQQQQQGQQQQQQRRGGGHKAETETTVDSDPTPTLLSSRHRRFPSDQNPHLAHHHLAAGSGSAGIGGDIVVENSTDILQPVIDATVICGAHDDLYHEYGTAAAGMGPAGDVSLTLGLRHAGTGQEKNRFTVRDYGGC